jgi:cytochrome c oxidase assembly protein Cox11
MVRVYFERGLHADLVAVFMDELTYQQCVPALERLCKDMGYDNVTESVEYSLATELIIDKINKL